MPLTSYIIPVLTGTVLMTVCYGLGRYGYSFAWIGLFIILNFLKNKLWKQRQKRIMQLKAAAQYEREVVTAEWDGRLQDLPAWVQFPDTERVEWINKLVLQMWPYIGEYAKRFIRENIQPIVRQNLPGPFKSFTFYQMDMGDIPVRIGGIKVYSENVGRDRVIMDLDVSYAGDCEFVVGVGAFKGGMNNLQFKGKLRCIMMPLVPQPPMVGGVSAYFLDNPTIDFNLTGMGEFVELPGLMGAIRSVVTSQVANICVLPNSITVPLMQNIDMVKLNFPEPDGIVRIHLASAKNLENRDISILKGKSDPYAIISVGAQMFKSKTIDDDLNPTWNEFYEAIVDQANGQRIVVEVFDEDPGSKDEFLGRVAIELSSVREKGILDQWLPLEGCKHGDILIKLYWMDLSKDPKFLEKSYREAQQWDAQWLKSDMTLNCSLLMVYVDSAKNLPSAKRDLEPSPFVELSVAKQIHKTYSRMKTANPVFQEKFLFLCDNPENQALKIEAKQADSNRSLGDTLIPISRLLKEPEMELYQQTFSLHLHAQASPIILTLRLRAFCAPIDLVHSK